MDYEKRFKDTQSAYTKSQQELKAAKARLEALEQLTQPVVQIDDEQRAQLERLKFSDPDAWRDKVNSLEADAKAKHLTNLNEVEHKAVMQLELERRADKLAEYNRLHPEAMISDDTIAYDLPPRITKRLEQGEISFDEFLIETNKYLMAPKTVGSSAKPLNQPNMGDFGGGTTPTEAAVGKSIAANYKHIIF